MKEEILILTWTISPSKTQGYKSASITTEIREKQYLKSLIFYITQSDFWKIVFCENSNYKFNKSTLDNLIYLSKYFGKEIELLHFKWNYEKVDELWYWYWDWECIDYAFDNSKIFQNNESFYKISWRYIIGNINRMIECYKNNNNFFMRDIPSFFSMNTWFFKMDSELYKKYFYNIKNSVNHWNKWLKEWKISKNSKTKEILETVFYSILYNNNLFSRSAKITVLPYRINLNEDNIRWKIYKYPFLKRPRFRFDRVCSCLRLYNFSLFDKVFFKLISPLTKE